jgi:hypothetical protein
MAVHARDLHHRYYLHFKRGEGQAATEFLCGVEGRTRLSTVSTFVHQSRGTYVLFSPRQIEVLPFVWGLSKTPAIQAFPHLKEE